MGCTSLRPAEGAPEPVQPWTVPVPLTPCVALRQDAFGKETP
jgi:hypothetical protein